MLNLLPSLTYAVTFYRMEEWQAIFLAIETYIFVFFYLFIFVLVLRNVWVILIKQRKYNIIHLTAFYALIIVMLGFRVFILIWNFWIMKVDNFIVL